MKSIIIATSFFGNPVSDFYKAVAEQFIAENYKIVFVFDGLIKELPQNTENCKFYSWKNKRPTGFKDFMFFYNLVKKEKPTLCISNFGSHNIVSIVSFLLGVKNNINYIHTTTIALDADNTKNLIYTKYTKFRKKLIYQLNTHFFTNSNGNKEDFSKANNIDFKNITVIPLLIKDTPISLKSYHERDFSICIVGRLHPCKGHKNLLRCFKAAITKFPKLTLKIAGSGYLLDELQKDVDKLGIQNNVFFLGNLNQVAVSNLFSSSLIAISSSIDEAFGLVNIEALREGTPLLCTKTAGSLDIVQSECNGLYFDTNNELTFTLGIEKIITDYESYSKNARQSFIEIYDLSKVTKCFEIIKQFT